MFHFSLGLNLVFRLFVFFVVFSFSDNDCNFFSNSLWKKCGYENSTTEECLNSGCCMAPKEFLHDRNITWGCLKKKERLNVNGTCLTYKGKVCDEYFNKSSNETKLRYIDNSFGITKTNQVFEEFFQVLGRVSQTSLCYDTIAKAMCEYGVPECTDNGGPQLICREDCEYVLKACPSDFSRLLGAIQMIVIYKTIDFAHLDIPNCMMTKYSYDLENGTCTYVFSDIDRQPPRNRERTNKKLYIFIGVGLLLLIILFTTVYCFKRRRMNSFKKRMLSMQSVNTEGQTMTSIRDRIRGGPSESLAEKLVGAKPGELIQYPLDCVEYIKDLGEGQFGKVFQGRVHGVVKGEESTYVAVKCLKEGSSSQALDAFNKEVLLMSSLKHMNILQLLAVSTEEEPFCMIFEFMENGDLNEYLRKSKNKERLSEESLITICQHVACGMEYLAKRKFLHRDLATRNCLVDKDLFVKIADFGMSRDIYHSDYYRVGGEAMLPIRWMPPEAILYGKFTVAADIYSFGVVMWEIFSFAMQPFYGHTNDEVIQFIKKGVMLPRPEECPDWIYDIMIQCWKQEPKERLPFSRALRLLKGQNNDYDIPEEAEDIEVTGYDVIHSHSTYNVLPNTSTYDMVPNQANEVESNLPDYQNVSVENNTAPNAPADYQNITPNKTEPPSMPPVDESGVSNPTYEDHLGAEEQADVNSLKTSSMPSPNKAVAKKQSKKKNMHKRAVSLGGGRSIKEILRDEQRYVKRDSLEKRVSADGSSFHSFVQT